MRSFLNRPAHPNAIERFLVTVTACLLGALVALVAPPAFWPALDLAAGWAMMLGSAVVFVLIIDDVTPDVARAVGRNAFRVARGAYKIANRK